MKSHKTIIISLIFILSTSLAAHFMFSRFGFNPTDDGFYLANSRRVLDGEIPHRDFISIRPPLTYYLYVLVLLLKSDYTLLITRYIFILQISLTSLAWILIANKLLKLKIFNDQKGVIFLFVSGILCFIYCLHNFPIMAWNTVDGMFLASIGTALLLYSQKKLSLKITAYIMIGSSLLFKQNFALFPIVIFVSFLSRENFLPSLSMVIPGFIYLFFLAATDALKPAFEQLRTYSGLNLNGYTQVTKKHHYLVTGAIYSLFLLSKKTYKLILAATIGLITLLFISQSLKSAPTFFARHSYYLFYFVLANFLFSLINFKKEKPVIVFNLLALSMAFCVSISIGYRSVALASGILLLSILVQLYQKIRNNDLLLTLSSSLLFLVLLLSIKNFIFMRTYGVYRDKPAKNLTYDLGDVVKGAKGIKTNKLTYDYLKDLDDQVKNTTEKYVILPDNSIHWVLSEQRNPLIIDWPQNTELGSTALKLQVNENLKDHMETGGVAIVEKISPSTLFVGELPLPDVYASIQFLKANYAKISESHFFEVYQK